MSRSTVARCGALAGIATLACWTGKPPPRDTPLENSRPSSADDPTAPAQEPYWCSISDNGFEYPQMPCAIRTVRGTKILAKLAGSQRFRGSLTPRDGALLFAGELYCPWGDCQKPLHGRFEPVGNGALRGTFEDDAMVVTLVPAPADSAWGGASYGGDGSGGFGYGAPRQRQ